MPAKIARLATRPPFWIPEVLSELSGVRTIGRRLTGGETLGRAVAQARTISSSLSMGIGGHGVRSALPLIATGSRTFRTRREEPEPDIAG
jgi:hypothetical protein